MTKQAYPRMDVADKLEAAIAASTAAVLKAAVGDYARSNGDVINMAREVIATHDAAQNGLRKVTLAIRNPAGRLQSRFMSLDEENTARLNRIGSEAAEPFCQLS